ncbi:MAG: rhamnulokinase [Oscillospiraceae bacterium]|nr:rhamnulokinase [Oscillospiraceae bacterium]
MTNYYLAVDIGASSGRHVLGWLENGKLQLREIYRFDNGFEERDGKLVWDAERLFQKVVNGLRRCNTMGYVPKSVAVDTWGVDYVLLDSKGKELWPAHAYRDARGAKAQAAVHDIIAPEKLFVATGIAQNDFNSIYQLWDDKLSGRLDKAAHILMLPEYLHWRLTGEMRREYTMATTTGLVNATTGDWDWDIIAALGYPKELFAPLHKPGTLVGELKPEIVKEVGYSCNVVLPGTHDTASAVAACPAEGNALYISSGTWSLMGTELDSPLCSEQAQALGFTNEGGANGKIRLLRNIMGLWMLQQIKREHARELRRFEHVIALAQQSSFVGELDVRDAAFNTPPSMTEAVRNQLGLPELPLGDVIAAVYHGLARCYAETARGIEALTSCTYDTIHIIGGGSQDGHLNALTAQHSGKQVATGPVEATAMGNLLAQLIAGGEIADFDNGRALIRASL